MSRLASIAALLLLVVSAGCESQKSKLDGVQAAKPSASTTPSVVADHSGDTDTRLRRLEDNFAKYAEALDFLQKVYGQQKQQEQQQQASEPDPNAVFAVDIKQNLQLGMVEGPAQGALVTIVEAFDFA